MQTQLQQPKSGITVTWQPHNAWHYSKAALQQGWHLNSQGSGIQHKDVRCHTQQPNEVLCDEDDQQILSGAAEGIWRVQGYHHPGRVNCSQQPQALSAQLLSLQACGCVDLQKASVIIKQSMLGSAQGFAATEQNQALLGY